MFRDHVIPDFRGSKIFQDTVWLHWIAVGTDSCSHEISVAGLASTWEVLSPQRPARPPKCPRPSWGPPRYHTLPLHPTIAIAPRLRLGYPNNAIAAIGRYYVMPRTASALIRFQKGERVRMRIFGRFGLRKPALLKPWMPTRNKGNESAML